MAAYVIGTSEITDPAGMEEYRNRVGSVIERYGGRFLAAGAPEVREGDLRPHVAVIIEFPSLDQARTWYDSADYRELKAVRQRSTRGTTLFLDGLPTS
jgi:uncharacterized protein (DUF1330 family)